MCVVLYRKYTSNTQDFGCTGSIFGSSGDLKLIINGEAVTDGAKFATPNFLIQIKRENI